MYYIDASADRYKFVLTALRIPLNRWRTAFEQAKEFRRYLKKAYGLFYRKELHSTELIRGKGHLSTRTITKSQRARIFSETLELIAKLPDIQILNVCIKVPGCPVDPYLRAFERMLNRIEAKLKDASSNGILVLDEGKEGMIRRVARNMAVFNWIPSAFGAWEGGARSKNISVSRAVEDPVFRMSSDSYFLQFADVAAFALLKREVVPTPIIERYGIHKMWEILKPVRCLEVSPNDPDGIERG